MYEDVATQNRFLGCNFRCSYCVPSFQATVRNFARLRGSRCKGCLNYTPHEHPEWRTFPSKPIIFLFGDGDISFARPPFVRETIQIAITHLDRCPHKTLYLQSKNPVCFEQYLPDLRPIEQSVVLLTTLETNRDAGYEKISKAPVPSQRFKDFLHLRWPRKIVTIEPVMQFDLDPFVSWIKDIGPEAVYLGYNSRPQQVQLPSPMQSEFWGLYEALRRITPVRLKRPYP